MKKSVSVFVFAAVSMLTLCVLSYPALSHASAAPAKKADIWFAPRSPIPGLNFQGVDFMDLFGASAPWSHAESHVKVFKLYSQFIGTNLETGGSTDADLHKVFLALRQHHIAPALEAGLLTNPELCGKIEGYTCSGISDLLARIKNVGGTLDYVAMDEPLWHGHFANEPGALHSSIRDLVKDIATQVASVHQHFPNAKIGDIETLGAPGAPGNYVYEVTQFMDAYQVATGHPLAFLHMDINWQASGWQEELVQLAQMARARGIRFGIIYDSSNPAAQTGVEWIASTKQNFIGIENTPAAIPDDAILQSWNAQPDHALPETKPGTMSCLVDSYLNHQEALAAHKVDADSSKIAFVNRQNSIHYIYLMNVNASGMGSDASRLTQDEEQEDYPSWSPDGTKIVYQRSLNGAATYVVNADGTDEKRLSPTPGMDVTPSWSPDGTQIVYARLHQAPGPNVQPLTDIRIMNADGTNDHAVLANVPFSVEPRWSVKNQLVFMSYMNSPRLLQIFTVKTDGTGLRQLTNSGNNGEPVWSPDGSHITFGSDREGGNKLNIFKIDAEGTTLQQLTHFDPPYEAGDTNWSSDGKKITFEFDINGVKQSAPDAVAQVWTMNADGSDQTNSQMQCSDVGCAPRLQPKCD